jgi:quercetin dioxygenase-like cupin family protein
LTVSKGEEKAMKEFPDFIMHPVDRVANVPDPGMVGAVFEGAKGTQIVFWECQAGGESPEHFHEYWEYAIVVQGTCDCIIDGKPVRLEPGDECAIPPGVKHSGRYSTGYRAIDAFGGKRVVRVSNER